MDFHEFEAGGRQIRHGERTLEVGRVVTGYWSHADHLLITVEAEGGLALHIYDAVTHELRHCIGAPDGWELYRLTRWVDDQPSIVAVSDEAPNGHMDWHWLIDIEHGTLERVSPSR